MHSQMADAQARPGNGHPVVQVSSETEPTHFKIARL